MKKMTNWKCFRFLATLALHDVQLDNYVVKIIQMTLDLDKTDPFQLNFL